MVKPDYIVTMGQNQALSVINTCFVKDPTLTRFENIEYQLKEIQARLNILVPDPSKLEKHENLRLAYENYKLMEKLLNE